MKDSFVLYRSVYEAVKHLPGDMFKEWVLAVMEYGLDQKEPETPLGVAGVGAVRKWMDDDDEAYQRKVERNRKNGALGGRPKKTEENPEKPSGFSEEPNKTQSPPDDDNDDYKEKDSPKGESKKKRFVKPTADEVTAYAREKGLNVDGERFCDYYESKGWLVGRTPMKDWKAAVRTWGRQEKKPVQQTASKFHNFTERKDDLDAEMVETMKRQREEWLRGTA